MKRIVYIFLCLSFVVACKEEPRVYEGHYPQAKFVEVVRDIYVAEAALKDVSSQQKDSLVAHYKSIIEELHQVDLKQVEADLEVIQSSPELYKKIHGIISDSVIMLEKRVNKQKEKKINRDKDSN